MHRGFPSTRPLFRPRVEALEDRCLLAVDYRLEPIVPTIDAGDQAVLREVLGRGLQAGNRVNVFAKAGDSITSALEFLRPLGALNYNPFDPAVVGGYGYLGSTVGFFRGPAFGVENSFTRTSAAAFPGWTSAQVLATLPGELDLTHPAFVLVMAGTDDAIFNVSPDTLRQNLTEIVQVSMDRGVVPILSTIPDILFPDLVPLQRAYNQVIAEVAESTHAPLWNYWLALQSVPHLGIRFDGVHPSVFPGGAGVFTDIGLQFGYNVRNLTAVQTLDHLKQVLLLGGLPDLPGGQTGWAPLSNTLVVSAGDRASFQVETIDPVTRSVLFRFNPFPGFLGSVRTALGDVNGDGVPDLIAVPGPGAPPNVKVFDGVSGLLLSSFFAYDPGMWFGLEVAAGDINGDGLAEIITTVDAGGPGHVRAFDGNGTLLASFFAFDPSYLGGAKVAAGDVDGNAVDDIVVSAGVGGHGHIRVFSGGDFDLIQSFLPHGPLFLGTLSLAAGDVDGDGIAEIATGVESGGGPHVQVFRGSTVVASFFAYAPGFPGGVRVALLDANNDGRDELVTAPASGAVPHIRILDPLRDAELDAFFSNALISDRGVFLAG
jgi:GDSL-like Lipase/Acylhydrolase family/FG-GAP-like repeat/FG-GAP repeat